MFLNYESYKQYENEIPVFLKNEVINDLYVRVYYKFKGKIIEKVIFRGEPPRC